MKKRQGIVFFLALIVIVAVGILLAAAGSRIGAEIKGVGTAEDDARADAAARAGIQRALADLSGFNANLLQPQSDDWAALGDGGNMEFVVGRASFRLQLVDAGSFVNLNTAPQAQLQNLGLNDEQIDSLMDWRETGSAPRQLGGKDEFYNLLTEPYNAKLAKLDTVDEVLLVKGFTPETLLAPPTNTTSAPLVTTGGTPPALIDLVTVDSQCSNTNAQGQARTNLNSASAQELQQAGLSAQLANQIVQRRTTQGDFASLGQVFALPGAAASAAALLDRFTATTDQVLFGRVNLNTATEPVLRSIPNLPSQAVDSIVASGGGYTSLGDLATVSGVQTTDLANLADVFTVGSQVLVVRSLGTYGSKEVGLEAFIDMSSTPPKVRRVQRVIPPDPVAYWGWPTETNQQTVLMEATP